MTERRATIEDSEADISTLRGRLRRLAWLVQQTTVGVAGGDEHELTRELLTAADDASELVWLVESHNSDQDTGGIEGAYSSKGNAEKVQELWDHEGDINAWVEGPFVIDGPPVTDPEDLAKEED